MLIVYNRFQWANLQIKQLFELETEEAIRDRLGRLPNNLKATYDGNVRQRQVRHGHEKELADRTFTWVMCAYKPLASETLLAAIRLDPSGVVASRISESSLSHICNNLLVLDSQRKVWKFSHLSVREYFENNHWRPEKAHCYIAKVCLHFLIETYKESASYYNQSKEEKSNTITAPSIFSPNVRQVKYASAFWVGHVQT